MMTATTQSHSVQLSDLEAVDLSQVKLDLRWAYALPAQGVRRFRAIGLCRVGETVVVATCNPRVAMVEKFVAARLGHPVRLVRTDEAAFRRLLSHLYASQKATVSSEAASEVCETVDVCDALLRAAFLRGASDIHLLPSETELQVRFRVDGVLEDYRVFSSQLQSGLISRIKVLAGMNIAEKREPQDGRCSVASPIDQRKIDVRVATIPTRHGERVTIRLLTPMLGTPSLDDLGMGNDDLQLFSSAIDCSNGLVLLTGPTGCGKSTTLYTAITHLLRQRGGNVITIEDPIEFEIPGASQVEVDASEKVSFSRALRSILRHDPDVIMLGEIRDAETAELAIKASLTGHLVFSTLHTNTAAGVVTRLIDVGVEPFLIAATLRLAVAQRLVRRLCPKCKVQTCLAAIDATALGHPDLAGQAVYEASGCVYCAGQGFVGRSALFEMLPGGNDMSDLISAGATETELLGYMQRCHRPLLVGDGIDKLLAGTTTVKQVLSAVARW